MPPFREGSITPIANDGLAPATLAEWLASPIGSAVSLANSDEVAQLVPHLSRLKLITLLRRQRRNVPRAAAR